MHPSLKSIREAHELTLQYRSRQSTMLVEELIEDKLRQLLAFINRLEQTPLGTAELRGRIDLPCGSDRRYHGTDNEHAPHRRPVGGRGGGDHARAADSSGGDPDFPAEACSESGL